MRNLSALAMLIFFAACSRNENPEAILRSPNGDYTIELYGKDLGACCTSRTYANIASQGDAFEGLDERLFEIEGGSNVEVNWVNPYHVEVRVCNAKDISYKSDFSNHDFSQYIHVSVENTLPQRTNGEVICSERSEPTTASYWIDRNKRVRLKDSQATAYLSDWGMRTGIEIKVTSEDSQRLEAIVSARNSPQKHVWRARIILLTAQCEGTQAIMAATGKSKTCVWRWQERFMKEGVDGLLRDKTRPPGIAPLEPALVEKVVALTLEPPAHEATHWTVRAMAKAVGIAASSVKIWREHGLAPHRWVSIR